MNKSKNKFKLDGADQLPATGSFKTCAHEYTEETAMALWAAYVTGRPLLLRGEPGTGKSQIARAAAHCLRAPLITHVVDARTEPQDLRYQFDAVARLADAQALQPQDDRAAIQPHRYIVPGPLWWAFNWTSASDQAATARVTVTRPEIPKVIEGEQYSPDNGCVLLLDEIDKADSDVPNGLLESLGNTGFAVPYVQSSVTCGEHQPLVIITTNEERELPAAFVRRCLVLQLELPKNPEKLSAWLAGRAKVHNFKCDPDIVQAVAMLLMRDRERAEAAGFTPPGQAEFLDMLSALSAMAPGNSAEQERHLKWVSRFALSKQPGQQLTEQ